MTCIFFFFKENCYAFGVTPKKSCDPWLQRPTPVFWVGFEFWESFGWAGRRGGVGAGSEVGVRSDRDACGLSEAGAGVRLLLCGHLLGRGILHGWMGQG